jgi:RNA polymerase sigma factor (sigma-70 family)
VAIPLHVAERDASSVYHKLVTALAAQARRMGSKDAEGAAHEALKRSLATPAPRAAIDYYFDEHPASNLSDPEWSLERLFAWLYGVLRFVVREEYARVSARREIPGKSATAMNAADSSADQLHRLLDDEMKTIVRECLGTLDHNYRDVLVLRAKGLKYVEIATRLGVNENTVATWVRRATRTMAQLMRRRMNGDAQA